MSARNALVLFLALSTLAFLVACGSSNPAPQPPPGGGSTATNFNGTYVISISGADYTSSTTLPNGSSFALTGTIAPNGSGSINGGAVDVIDPALAVSLGSTVPVQTDLPVTGTYRVTPDGRGTGSITVTFDGRSGQFGFDFVLTQNGHGLITRFDGNGTGSGTIDLQGTASQSSLTSLAFSLSGADGSESFNLASAGGFALDSSGNITAGSGFQDFNEGGSSAGLTSLPLSGSLVLSSGTAGTAQLATSVNSLAFDVFVIDSTHLKFIETDAIEFLSGDAFTQQASFPQGALAFTLSGFDSSGDPFAAGGLMTSTINGTTGNLSGFEDYNDFGNALSSPAVTASCTTFIAGRCQLVFTGFTNGSAGTFQFAAYPSSGGVQLLEVDSFGITQGAAYAQSSTALSAPQGYGLNLTGFDLNSGTEVDDIAEFTAQSVGSNSSGSLTGIVDINDAGNGPPVGGQGLGSSTYTPDSPATGRGSITIGNANILPAGLEYYTVDSSTAIFIETDSSQVAVGTLELQNASSSPGAAQPASALFRPAVLPTLRSRTATAKKK